jgi:hypothetical protein
MPTQEIAFVSRLPREHRQLLETLLFFNRGQGRVRSGILAAIERFGAPEILEQDASLRVRVDGSAEVQSLFAVERTGDLIRPIGVVVYVRDSFERITVLHMVVAEEFAAAGLYGDQHLPLRLVHAVRRIARRTSGIRHIELLYSQRRLRAAAVA